MSDLLSSRLFRNIAIGLSAERFIPPHSKAFSFSQFVRIEDLNGRDYLVGPFA